MIVALHSGVASSELAVASHSRVASWLMIASHFSVTASELVVVSLPVPDKVFVRKHFTLRGRIYGRQHLSAPVDYRVVS